MDHTQLKSGTDIRGVAVDGVEGQPVTLTDAAVEAILASFLMWCKRHLGLSAHGLRVAVGRDSRVSGPRIVQAIQRVLLRYGAVGLDCGLASTPSMFLATLDLDCPCAVQVTASHHPYYRNGLKFFTKEGGLDGPDIAEILEGANQGLAPAKEIPGSWEQVDHMTTYAATLRDIIKKGVNAGDYDHPLQGFHIVVDAGNGAGGFYATDVLAPLGADITGSQFLEPDGMFPNHIPNPEDQAAMDSIARATVKAGADLGVIFDTDVDRGGAVDREGKEINRNRLVALASAIALENCPGGTIVTDSITSDGLKEYIERTLGGRHYRYQRGYKNVINKALELNAQGVDCPLAIETSGHAAMRDNYFLDDGAYLVTQIIIKLARLRQEGKDLEDLLAPLKEPMEAAEVRLPILDKDFREAGQSLIDELEIYARAQGWAIAPDNREGLRVSFPRGEGDGWFLLRLSVHDPILPLNLESNSHGGVAQIAEKLKTFFQAHYDGVDVSPVEKL